MTPTPDRDAPDRSRSLAILVGAFEYPADPELTSLPAVANSLDAMEKLLTGELCGWPRERVRVYPNPASSHALLDDIAKLATDLAGEAKDAVLFYYVGHGLLVDGGSQLGMAVSGTNTNALRLKNTSLLLSSVRELLFNLGYRTRIEILDCCYSGLATNALGGARNLGEEVRRAAAADVKGLYTVTASRRNEVALYSPGDDGLTYFTGYLKEVIGEGIDGARRWLTMAEVFEALRAHFAGLDDGYLERPQPTQSVIGIADRFEFARNTAFREGAAFREDAALPVREHEDRAGAAATATRPQWARRAVLATAAGASLVGAGAFAAWGRGRTQPSAQPGSQSTVNTRPAETYSTPGTTGPSSTAPTTANSAKPTTTSAAATPHHFTKAVPVAGSPLALGGPQVLAVALSRSGRNLLAAGDQNGGLVLWDTADFSRPKRLGARFGATGTAYGVYSLDFSPLANRQILAAGNSGGQILLWDLADLATPRLLKQFSSGAGEGCSVSFSADGSMLASASEDGFVSIWVTGDPDNVYAWGPSITGHEGAVNAAVFSPRQYLVASGGYDDTVRLWNIGDPSLPQSLHVIKETDGPVQSLAFSPDGNTLAAGKASGVVRLYDVTAPSAPKLRDPLPQAQQNKVNAVAFSQDGLLACASADQYQSVLLYDLADPAHPRPIQRNLAAFRDQASSVAFTADGRGLAAGGIDSTIELWQLS